MPLHTIQLGIGKRHWNLETSSAVVEFPPPYPQSILVLVPILSIKKIFIYIIYIYLITESGVFH